MTPRMMQHSKYNRVPMKKITVAECPACGADSTTERQKYGLYCKYCGYNIGLTLDEED